MKIFWIARLKLDELRLTSRLTSALGFCLIATGALPALAQTIQAQPVQKPTQKSVQARLSPKPLQVIVTSAQDGPVEADGGLTLLEAIALTNGDLSRERLSPQEAALVQGSEQPQILFRLPGNETTIRLKTALPPAARSRAEPRCNQSGWIWTFGGWLETYCGNCASARG